MSGSESGYSAWVANVLGMETDAPPVIGHQWGW